MATVAAPGAHGSSLPLAPGPVPTPDAIPDLAAILARRPGENFTVASRILPRRHRRDLLAIYGFARLVDDLGDQYDGDRLAALDWVEAELDRGAAGRSTHPAVAAIVATLAAHHMSDAPLRDLLDANRQDQQVRRYRSFEDLVGYCRLSADPIGHLVLGVFDADGPHARPYADAICTALQLAEHWQDVAEDARAGRVYLPEEDLHRFGLDPDQLVAAAVAPETAAAPVRSALRGLLVFEVARARELLVSGLPLLSLLRGLPRVAVAGFAAGGLAALDAVADADFEVLGGAPRPRAVATGSHLVRLLARRATGDHGGAR